MIQVENLTKTYRVSKKNVGLVASLKSLFAREWTLVDAVKGINFEIQAGERVGFLGPNGAGKTTTLKMLSGLLTPTDGRIDVLGFDPRHRSRGLLCQISLVMGQKQQLLWDLPPIDTLDLNRAIFGIHRDVYDRTLKELTELLELEPLLQKPTRQLSLGERMKCELAAALIHRPKVLFLDEPTIGLDVTMQATVRSFIKNYNQQTGATVILTSHYMDDVAELCQDRIIVIDRGEIRYDGNLVGLASAIHPEKVVQVSLAESFQPPQDLNIVECTERTLTVSASPEQIPSIVKRLLDELPVTDLKVEEPPLEDTMRRFFVKEKQG